MKKLVEQQGWIQLCQIGAIFGNQSEYFPSKKHVIQGRPTKNYSVDCIQENHQKSVFLSPDPI
jgi:hypothetical protein